MCYPDGKAEAKIGTAVFPSWWGTAAKGGREHRRALVSGRARGQAGQVPTQPGKTAPARPDLPTLFGGATGAFP